MRLKPVCGYFLQSRGSAHFCAFIPCTKPVSVEQRLFITLTASVAESLLQRSGVSLSRRARWVYVYASVAHIKGCQRHWRFDLCISAWAKAFSDRLAVPSRPAYISALLSDNTRRILICSPLLVTARLTALILSGLPQSIVQSSVFD